MAQTPLGFPTFVYNDDVPNRPTLLVRFLEARPDNAPEGWVPTFTMDVELPLPRAATRAARTVVMGATRRARAKADRDTDAGGPPVEA